MLSFILLLAVLLVQQSPPASIEGTVVNLSSGAPVATATLELTSIEGGKVISRTATTGQRGEFSFRDVPPGSGYQLVARAQGFRISAYGQRDARDPWVPITLTPGQRMTNVRITVSSLTQLGGRVKDSSGRGLSGATVIVLGPSYVEGRRELERVAVTTTNAQGEYRFFNLTPGTYYVRASSLNAPGDEPVFINPALADRNAAVNRRNVISGEPEGYRTVYYPGTALESARPISVGDGQTASGIDITIQKSSTGRVRGSVIDATASRKIASAQVSLFPIGVSTDSNWVRSFQSKDGTFDFRGVMPGMYALYVVTGSDEQPLAGRMIVEVRKGNNAFDLRVSPAPNISGRILMEDRNGRAADLSTATVNLLPGAPGPRDGSIQQGPLLEPTTSARVQPDGTFTLRQVIPWDYEIRVAGIPGAYLKSARDGDADVAEGRLRVDIPRDRPLEITLSTNTGGLDGRVLTVNSEAAPYARVVLVPRALDRHDLYLTLPASDTGRFQLKGIPPGQYTVFAWKKPPEWAWMDPDFLEAYKGKGKTVEIAGGSSSYVELTVIDD